MEINSPPPISCGTSSVASMNARADAMSTIVLLEQMGGCPTTSGRLARPAPSATPRTGRSSSAYHLRSRTSVVFSRGLYENHATAFSSPSMPRANARRGEERLHVHPSTPSRALRHAGGMPPSGNLLSHRPHPSVVSPRAPSLGHHHHSRPVLIRRSSACARRLSSEIAPSLATVSLVPNLVT